MKPRAVVRFALGEKLTPPRLRHVLVLVASIAAAYAGVLRHPFIFDDDGAIVQNASIRSLGDALSPPSGTTVAARPVLNLTLAMDFAVGRLDPLPYRLTNVAIHAAAALLLYGVVRRTPGAGGGALAAALLWALHPLQTESVTYVIQRAESLMGLFYLLTLYAAIRRAQGGGAAWEGAAAAACALGMGTKEVMATAPLVVLAYDRIFLAGSWRETFRRRGRLHALLAVTWAVPAALIAGSSHAEVSRDILRHVTPFQYAMTESGAIVHYLRLAFLPVRQCLDYVWPISLEWTLWLPTAVGVAGLLGSTVALLRRAPAAGFLGLWFFVILAPTSSFLPLADVAFEHRMYLPSAAVAVALAVACVSGRGMPPRWGRGIVACVALCFFFLTVSRNRDYRTDAAAWREVLRETPGNPRARSNLGNALYQEGRVGASLLQFDRAIALRPDYADAHFNRGVSLARAGRTAEAEEAYRRACELGPRHRRAPMNLGALLLLLGRPEEALEPLERARALTPRSADVLSNLGVAHMMLGRLDEAEALFAEAVACDPRHADAHANRGILLRGRGKVREAAESLAAALAISPSHAGANATVGEMLLAAGHPREAAERFERALAAEPNHAGALRGLAAARERLAENIGAGE